ncbi:MAG TPA: hypothetical protein VHD83_07820 [Puia sp.]|nr:hypothetical protein [Puia sp.]
MYHYLKPGVEVTFQCLHDIKLIVEEFNEHKGNVRCKYYDDNLHRFIKLTLPAESLTPVRKTQPLKVSRP